MHILHKSSSSFLKFFKSSSSIGGALGIILLAGSSIISCFDVFLFSSNEISFSNFVFLNNSYGFGGIGGGDFFSVIFVVSKKSRIEISNKIIKNIHDHLLTIS
jgi:hypothetical protein